MTDPSENEVEDATTSDEVSEEELRFAAGGNDPLNLGTSDLWTSASNVLKTRWEALKNSISNFR